MKKFNVGDIIVYDGGVTKRERGREQIVLDYSNEMYYTEFLDNGGVNSFHITSTYYEHTQLKAYSLIQYGNGIPVLWEDNI